MDSIIDVILGTIGTVLYGLFNILFILIDALYGLFKSFAGVGDMRYAGEANPITGANGGGLTDTGIIYYLLQSDIVKNMFISILLLGLFLLIIFSVMAFIKNAYAAKPKTWQEIIGNAFRGLANFVVVPVCCLLGIWGGNILLKAIDGATSNGSTLSLAGRLFVSSAYNANKIRSGDLEITDNLITILTTADENLGDQFKFDSSKKEDKEYVAGKVDELFSSGLDESMSYGNVFEVGEYYNTFDINYLIIIVGGLFMCYVMLTLTYAMIRRMFIILMLFIISPAVNSYYPLDEGKAAGSWKSEFVKQVTSAYGAIAGMNLFFSLLPLVRNIQLTGSWAMNLLNLMGITELIITICGLLIVKEFISMISSYFGLENAYDKGASLRSSVKSKIKDAGGKVTSTASAFGKAAGAGKSGGAKSFFGSLAGQATGSALKGMGIDAKGIKDSYTKSKEETGKRIKEKHDKNKLEAEYNYKNGASAKNLFSQFSEAQGKDKFTEEQIHELLSRAGTDDKLREFIAGKIAKHDSGYSDQYGRVNLTAEKVLEGDKNYNDKLIKTANHAAAQKEFSENQTARTQQINTLKADDTSINSLVVEYFDAIGADLLPEHLINFDNDGRMIKDDDNYSFWDMRLDKDRMSDLRRAGESGDDSARQEYEALKAIERAIKSHDKEESKLDIIDNRLEASAQKVASTLEAAAEYQKDIVKQGMLEAADKLKTKIEDTTQAFKDKIVEVGDIFETDVKDAFSKIKQEIRDAADELNKKRTGSGGTP